MFIMSLTPGLLAQTVRGRGKVQRNSKLPGRDRERETEREREREKIGRAHV